tara:strand:+ start:449 stop:1231 length:783 start_codon:yes stop_codon:yes gene_type:complete
MYRFSDGLMFTGSTEKAISYLVFQSRMLKEKEFKSSLWTYWGEKPEGTRIYKSNLYGRLKIFKKPLDDKYMDFLFKSLDLIEVKDIHPVLNKGFKLEAKRLFQKIDNQMVKKFIDFIDFLNLSFNLESQTKSETKLLSYSDDIGPFMLGSIGTSAFVIPETPKLFLAPPSWRKITWIINNYFSGPYPKDSKNPDLNFFHWNNLKLGSELNSPYYEGIAYFLIAKFIIIYEAFSKKKKCSSLNLYIDLIQRDGIRPWRDLF